MTASYIEKVVRAFPGDVKQVWLIGSRADGSAKPSSDWDYILIGNQAIVDALSDESSFDEPSIDLMVVYDGDQFCKPWPDDDGLKHGSLSAWNWHQISDTEATYDATKPREDNSFCSYFKTVKAIRVYPAPPSSAA